MSHYEERLERDLQQINQQVRQLATRVETSVKDAVHALLTGNKVLAASTILADGPINRAMRHIDALCHSFIAVHLPSAGHLRLVSSIFRANILLERIGDYAVTICRELGQLSQLPEGELAGGVELMATESRNVLKYSIQAFEQGNVELAQGSMSIAAEVQATFSKVFEELLDEQKQWPLIDRFAIFVVYHRLERIADQAKNLCEEAIFQAMGKTKPSKVYRILFLDQDGSYLAPMAAAIARKSFPESGEYSCAGWQAGSELLADMVDFMSERGSELATGTPVKLDFTPAELAEYHVIIGLQGANDSTGSLLRSVRVRIATPLNMPIARWQS
jgi:phosphate transport system protein